MWGSLPSWGSSREAPLIPIREAVLYSGVPRVFERVGAGFYHSEHLNVTRPSSVPLITATPPDISHAQGPKHPCLRSLPGWALSPPPKIVLDLPTLVESFACSLPLPAQLLERRVLQASLPSSLPPPQPPQPGSCPSRSLPPQGQQWPPNAQLWPVSCLCSLPGTSSFWKLSSP